jgi:hypothetical protein
MTKYYTSRFKDGQFRYATDASIDNGALIIKQTERSNNPKTEYRSVVILPLSQLKRMLKELGILAP